ncbi:MAG: lactate utilization protein [Chloroflexota bacterium]
MSQLRMNEFQKAAAAKEWYKETLAARVIKSLEKNNMTACYVKTREAALKKALSLIPKGCKVAHGGSLTLEEMGLLDTLRKRKKEYRFIDRRVPNLTDDDVERLRNESLLADVFLSSTNALTMDGKLVNIDGQGNRVAALLYGPKKVIIIAGINKIVPDQEAAMYRIQNYVTPVHGKRRDHTFPCTKVGYCVDCHTTQRACKLVTIIEQQRQKDRITVIICGEELGI